MRANKTKRRVPLSTGIGLYGREPRSQIETSGSLSLYFLCAFYIKIKGELLLLLIPPSHLRKFNKKKKIQRQVCGHEKCVSAFLWATKNKIIIFAWLFSCAFCSIARERDSERKFKKKQKKQVVSEYLRTFSMGEVFFYTHKNLLFGGPRLQ
jgi:hypothetical protein